MLSLPDRPSEKGGDGMGWMGVARNSSQWHSRARSRTCMYRHVGQGVCGGVVVCGGQRGLMLRYAGQDAFLL